MFVPAGHVGLLMDERQRYLFAQPGMHNIASLFTQHMGTSKLPYNKELKHGNRSILVVEQGHLGLAFDIGQPVLFPPGIHVWTSETLQYDKSISLDQHCVHLGPYTLITVDEGYAAVTQNNGKQQILGGGFTHLLDHKNWRFEKYLTLKIQTDDLEKIKATSADNITMQVTSTVTWRIHDPTLAATMAAETMAVGGGAVSSDITKLRQDVLKQAIASLASFIGGVNYSDSFHMAARAQGVKDLPKSRVGDGRPYVDEPEAETKALDNPLYDVERMSTAVNHANNVTMTYGVEILSINILTAVPVDDQLTKSLAAGAVASAQALQAETAARGNSKAMRIDAEATSEKAQLEAEGLANADVIRAKAQSEAARLVAEGNKAAADLLSTSQVAIDLAKIDKSASLIRPTDKFFFGQEPSYMQNIVLKGGGGGSAAGASKGSLFG
jgi:regulator of protease activity HflC (stomatin/prohibitin superfamily)